jgi:K+-sensing histidine kinase KdpD
MKTNLPDREVRNVRRFLTQSVAQINSMLKKSNLSSEARAELIKQKTELIKSREKLILRFEAKKTEIYSNQWRKTILELSDEKAVSSLIVGQANPILSIAELSERNVPKKKLKKS